MGADDTGESNAGVGARAHRPQGKMAFGPKGRPASAGKPRIPGDSTIFFDLEIVSAPGRETELIDIIGD